MKNIKKETLIILGLCLLIAGVVFFWTFIDKKYDMVVEPLSSDFVWGDDVQYELELSGEYELELAIVDKQEREVTDIYFVNERKAFVTVRTGLLDLYEYKAVLMYGDEIYFINLKEKGR